MSVPQVVGYSVRSDYIMRCQRQLGLETAGVTSSQQPGACAAQETIGGVSFWRTAPFARRLPLGVRELAMMRRLRARVEAAIREWKPDVVHAHSPMLVGIPALRAARKFKLPFVYELRDLWENPSVDRGKFAHGSPLYRAAQELENYVLRRADALVAICETLKCAIEPRAGRDASISVVDNGVDVQTFAPRARRPDLVARYGFEGKSVLAYVGTFQPYEGLELLLRAMPRIVAELPHARLLVVGGGGEQPKLVNLARNLGLERVVTFTGRIPHHEVPDVFPLGDLFVYPRVLTHTTALTTPLKPLEAMSMARPVLVSDIPPMRELVPGPPETGFVFKPGDADDLVRQTVAALRDSERLERVARAGRAYVVAERPWSRLVARYAAVYATAFERSRLPRPHTSSVETPRRVA
jgi:PEP-CTERM/exosortase A-associated glycosyltransferase